jgi:hypothetical protein
MTSAFSGLKTRSVTGSLDDAFPGISEQRIYDSGLTGSRVPGAHLISKAQRIRITAMASERSATW